MGSDLSANRWKRAYFSKKVNDLSPLLKGNVNLAKMEGLTFLRRGDLHDVVSQTHVFAKAVTDIVDRTICFDVWVSCKTVH